MKIVKTALKALAVIIGIAVVILVLMFLFSVYMMWGLPWENFAAKKAAAAYLEETYDEPMEVTGCGRFKREGYHASAQTINEPVINFDITMNIDKTNINDNYYASVVLYTLNKDLKDNIGEVYKGNCPISSVSANTYYTYDNLVENFDGTTGELLSAETALKYIPAGKIYVNFYFYDSENSAAESREHKNQLTNEDLTSLCAYILDRGYKPSHIAFYHEYYDMSDENGLPHKFDCLLEISFDENMEITNITGERSEEIILK